MKLFKQRIEDKPQCGERKTFNFFALFPVIANSRDELTEYTIWLERYNMDAIYSGSKWLSLGNYIIE